MAKRLTDTNKWAKQSFSDLSMKMKLVWIYLCDNCDHAGVWDMNLGLMSYQLGVKVTLGEIEEGLGDKIEVRGTTILLPTFIEFQYGELNPENRVHKSVLKRLENLAPKKPLTSPFLGAKDKDKDKDKDKEKEKGESEGGRVSQRDLDAAYHDYPRKEGKAPGMRLARAQIKTPDDLASLLLAIQRYRDKLKREGTEQKFILHFGTFMGRWRDWLEPDAGHSEDFSASSKPTALTTEQIRAVLEGA